MSKVTRRARHVAAAGGRAAADRAGAGRRQADPDRGAERPVQRVRRQHRAGQRDLGAARGRAIHRQDRHEGRDPRRRPSEQGRCRLRHRAGLVRPRRRGCGGRPRQLRRGAGGGHRGAREGPGVPGLGGRHDAADRCAVRADHGAVDVRHLHATRTRWRRRCWRRARTPGSSSPPTTRSARACRTRRRGRWSGTAARSLGSVKHPLNTADFSSYLLRRARRPAPRSWRWPMAATIPAAAPSRRPSSA